MIDTLFHIWRIGFLATFVVGGFVFDQKVPVQPGQAYTPNPMAIGVSGLFAITFVWPLPLLVLIIAGVVWLVSHIRKSSPGRR